MTRDRIFAVAATVAVLAGLALGFRELGPPARQRSENADRVRGRDLEAISRAVDNSYRLNNNHLPRSLEEVSKSHPGLHINDPETKAPYLYSVLGDTQYQLCANYASDNRTPGPAPGEGAHPAGTYCSSYVVNRLY